MEVKLRSIIRSTPWFSIIKAASLSLAWLSPHLFWIYLFFAFYFYFSQSFYSIRLSLAFATILGFSSILDRTLHSAALLAVLFFLLFGIKDLAFTKRSRIHGVLLFLMLLVLTGLFLHAFDEWSGIPLLITSAGFGILFFSLGKDLFRIIAGESWRGRVPFVAGLLSLLAWQLVWTLLFLPLGFLHRYLFALLVFIVCGSLIALGFQGKRTVSSLLVGFSLFFALAVVLLVSVRWSP